MNNKTTYTAKEVAELLQAEGDTTITSRTVNYYAFEKNMFKVSGVGKGCFTDEDVDKIRAIRLLQESDRGLTLEKIKEKINKYTINEIREICTRKAIEKLNVYGYLPYRISQGTLASSSYSTHGSDMVSSACSVHTTSSGMTYTHGISPKEIQYNHAVGRVDSLKQTGNSIRIIKVNDDITLQLSSDVDTKTLKKIIEYINDIYKG